MSSVAELHALAPVLVKLQTQTWDLRRRTEVAICLNPAGHKRDSLMTFHLAYYKE